MLATGTARWKGAVGEEGASPELLLCAFSLSEEATLAEAEVERCFCFFGFVLLEVSINRNASALFPLVSLSLSPRLVVALLHSLSTLHETHPVRRVVPSDDAECRPLDQRRPQDHRNHPRRCRSPRRAGEQGGGARSGRRGEARGADPVRHNSEWCARVRKGRKEPDNAGARERAKMRKREESSTRFQSSASSSSRHGQNEPRRQFFFHAYFFHAYFFPFSLLFHLHKEPVREHPGQCDGRLRRDGVPHALQDDELSVICRLSRCSRRLGGAARVLSAGDEERRQGGRVF